MNAPGGSSTSTSAVPPSLDSSSAQVTPAQAVTASTLHPHTMPSETASGVVRFFEKWGGHIVVFFLTSFFAGILGYSSAMSLLKDGINENKTEISVVKKEIEHVKEDVNRMGSDVAKIPAMQTDIIVIRTKLDISEENAKRKLR